MKSIDIDLEIRLSDLGPQFLRELELLEPYGIGNPKPVFLTRGLRVKKIQTKKIKSSFRAQFWVTDGNLIYEMTVPARARIEHDFESSELFDLVYTIDQRSWEGEPVTVLEAKDVKSPET